MKAKIRFTKCKGHSLMIIHKGYETSISFKTLNELDIIKQTIKQYLELEKIIEGKEWEIIEQEDYNRWFIATTISDTDYYLHKDVKVYDICGIGGFYKTKKEAERVLNRFLINQMIKHQ